MIEIGANLITILGGYTLDLAILALSGIDSLLRQQLSRVPDQLTALVRPQEDNLSYSYQDTEGPKAVCCITPNRSV